MAKPSKRSILLIVLTLCAALCFGLLVACKDNEDPPQPTDTSVAYTVTVMKDATTAASGVKVTVKKGGATFESKTTGDDGKAEFSLAPDSYTVVLSDLPDHYEVPEDANLTMTADSHDLTITLAKKFAYEVKLVNPDGTAYTGNGSVIVCTMTVPSNCLDPVTPVNGTANIETDKGNYHVKVDGLPAGYTYEQDDDGYYTKNFSATDTTMTIKICPVTTVDLSATPMTADEITAFKAAATSANALTTNLDAHKFTKSLTAGNAAYYTITPTVSGEYNIFRNDTLNYYFDGTTFSADAIASHIMPQYMTLEAGNTYYFKAVNTGNATATSEFVITVPVSTYIEYDGVGGNVELTIGKANTVAIVAFKPTVAGTYTLTAQGQTPAIVTCVANKPENAFLNPAPADTDYSVGSSAEVVYSAMDLAQHKTVYFTVTAKAEYPATITVKVEKTAENHDTFKYAEVQSTLTPYDYDSEEEGTELYGVPFDPTELVYDDTTDTYTYDGKLVVVKITKPNDENRFSSELALAYLDRGRDISYITYQVETANDAGGVDVVNYLKFIRGFENYAFGNAGSKEVPDELDEDNCYAANVNEDGVYPLNKELKDFLVAFYATNATYLEWNISSEAEVGTEWMFPLYYYDEASEVEADPICGEYYFLDEVAYILTVNPNRSFVIREAGEEDSMDSGSWSKNEEGNGYTFTCNDGGTLVYNPAKGVFTYSYPDYDDNIFLPPFIADYVCATDEDLFLSVNSDNTYSINDGYMSGTWQIVGDHIELAGDVDFTVTRNNETGALICKNSNDEIAYVFVYIETTFTSDDESATLTITSNCTFTLMIGVEKVVKGLYAPEAGKFFPTTLEGVLNIERVFGEGEENNRKIVFNVYYEDAEPGTIEFTVGGGGSGEEEDPTPTTDPICGEYTADDDFGSYTFTLTINAGGTFVIHTDDEDYADYDGIVERGTWSKDEDDEYEFKCEDVLGYGASLEFDPNGNLGYTGAGTSCTFSIN